MNHDEVEWQAQEIALEQERRRRDGANDDALVTRYRMIARALAEPPASALPEDFASALAARVGVRAEIDARFEQRLVVVLVVALVVSGLVVAAIYGHSWWSAEALMLPGIGAAPLKWLFAVLACVGISWTAGLPGSRSARR